jgi:hypothetical protein
MLPQQRHRRDVAGVESAVAEMTNGTNQTVIPPTRPLSAIELGVLEACQEATLRRRELLPLLAEALRVRELLPLLAEALRVREQEVFFTWALRRCKQSGRLEGTDWAYFFHGLECDVKNLADGRFLRFDFGPRGRVDTFLLWGVLQFIMTSIPPWTEWSELKRFFAQGAPPFNELSGSFHKMAQVWDSLAARGAFAAADPGLVDFAARHTVMSPEGLKLNRYPPGTPEETTIDCSVAHRLILSPCGHNLLKSHLADTHRAVSGRAS